MRSGERTHGPASLRISVPKSLPERLRAKVREVSHVWTDEDERKQGHASVLLRQVCDEADRQGLTLMLAPKRYGYDGLDDDGLMHWYSRRFGFFPLQLDPMVMLRLPFEVQPTERITMTPIMEGIVRG